ncbi:GNAT family N-acetyltransferase [Pseudoalteromonas fenneropenaei]|uniref:GNAT family N-acetyltransferase n=1 Tax=Pseudoalteromonas fenneropenaei TaxID=1737459 RepID=A0ABV7CPK3_9GAMM
MLISTMLRAEFCTAIEQVASEAWDALHPNHPFVRHSFLAALEREGCVGGQTGWLPQHWLCWQGTKLIAAVPGYVKSHSYGEYVFDWSWADAFTKYNYPYYPKWLAAVPFTPISGPRLLGAMTTEVQTLLCQHLSHTMQEAGWSGWHINFAAPELVQSLAAHSSAMTRHTVQFHWHNRGYADFTAFLATLTARRRKQVRKEREQVLAQITIRTLCGANISEQDIVHFYTCYQHTYLKRSGHTGYLNLRFFRALVAQQASQVVLMQAWQGEQCVAASLYLQDDTTLYGRYWGALTDLPGLHFELCYYQAIEYAIKQRLQTVNAGAQGEHKILRGFEPELTQSLHCMAESPFSATLAQFCHQERHAMAQYQQECRLALPFKHQ